MIIEKTQVSRRNIKKDRIAICPCFGCKYLEKVKPIKMSFLSFRKYPKCPKHRLALVFVDEFIGNFFDAVKACLFDDSSLPPNILISKIRSDTPDDLKSFINLWIYSNPIGRGGQIISPYIDGLSKGYMKLMSRKQKKAIRDEKYYKKYEMLRLGLKKITEEYTNFLRDFYEKSKMVYEQKDLHPLSKNTQLIIKGWLKNHLATLKELNNSLSKVGSLVAYKQLYDKILHAGTCSLLVGKAPSIIIKGVSAFKLFSTYHEFFKAGLCKELNLKDIKSKVFLNINRDKALGVQNDISDAMIGLEENKEKMNNKIIKILRIKLVQFKNEVNFHLKRIISSINELKESKEIILAKSLDILNDLILKTNNNEYKIPINSNPRVIATAILYTAAVSSEKSSKITMSLLESKTGIPKNTIKSYYLRHFRDLYPRKKFHFKQGFKDIRNRISIFFYNFLNKDINMSNMMLIKELSEIIKKKSDLYDFLREKDILLLSEMITKYEDEFIKYFSDLIEVIRYLIKASKIYRKIGAYLTIKALTNHISNQGVNLLLKFESFYRSVMEIYDNLLDKYPEDFPERFKINNSNELSRFEYRKIIGNKIKIYVVRNLYSGVYLIHNEIKCPKCHEEGFNRNTSQTRIASLEFHHNKEVKENKYTARNLCRLFENQNFNLGFLDDLIEQMEEEGVVVLCSNHHSLEHSKYYYPFRKIINWEEIPTKFPQDIFSLPSVLIHLIIWVSVFNFYKNKSIFRSEYHSARHSIVKNLKKKYILGKEYGNKCVSCLEFDIANHLPSFDFHHLNKPRFGTNPYIHRNHIGKIRTASDIFNKPYSSFEIVKILEYERGGYLCKNCHSVIQYTRNDLNLLKKIYDDNNIATDILNDYKVVKKRFRIIENSSKIDEPLKNENEISKTLIRFLEAVYFISKKGDKITIKRIMDYLGLSVGGVSAFFKRNWSFIRNFLSVEYKDPKFSTSYKNIYYLTDEGTMYIELIYYFINYYRNHQDIK